MPTLTLAEIMEYCEEFIKKDKLFKVKDRYKYRKLWVLACQAGSLERIATQLEDGQFSILEADNINNALGLIAKNMPQ